MGSVTEHKLKEGMIDVYKYLRDVKTNKKVGLFKMM